MSGFFYYGEASGARIIRGNVGTTQLTAASTEQVLMHAKTWDKQPGGPKGDVVFRDVGVHLNTTNGYDVNVTPIVDETDQTEQRFNGAGSVSATCDGVAAERGNRMAVEVEEVSRTGDVELEDVTTALLVLRVTP
jgi:hypothetical protein